MVNLAVMLVLALMVGGAGAYLYRAKKRGVKCVGCPDSKTCSGHCSGCCGGCGGCSGSRSAR